MIMATTTTTTMAMTITKPRPLRLLLVDDHPAIREALRRRLEVEPHFQVVGEAGNIPEAFDLIEAGRPDLAVIDVGLGAVCGLLLARMMRERYPEVRIIVWSMHARPDCVAEARAAGARGYVLKTGATGEVVRAIEVVAEGGCYYSAGLDQESIPSLSLTFREKQILPLVASGRSSAEIAKQLKIKRRTVESHRRSIMAKLGASNTVDMVVIAIGIGLIDVHQLMRTTP